MPYSKSGRALAQALNNTHPRQLQHRIPTPITPTGLLDLVRQDERHRSEAIREDISNRLRRACNYMGDEEFAALVDKMVQIQVGGERHRS